MYIPALGMVSSACALRTAIISRSHDGQRRDGLIGTMLATVVIKTVAYGSVTNGFHSHTFQVPQ